MPDLTDKHELWGTFSVMDHLHKGAFLPEVVLYDTLLIPIPPDPKRAKTDEDRAFAEKQRARWKKMGWKPKRLERLITILGPVAEPIEWDRQRHEDWAKQYADYAKKNKPTQAADLVGRMMAGQLTGEVLLKDLPAKAEGAVAVAPFTSLAQLKDDLGISEAQDLSERLHASQGLRGNLVSAVVGREFLLPTDPDWNEFDLLREAVDLVGQEDYRDARRVFHAEMLRFIRDQQTDYDSVKGAVEAMELQLKQLDQLARKRKRWRRAGRGFFFSQLACDAAIAPLNPVSLIHAGIAVGAYTTTQQLGKSANPAFGGPSGALLHDAQRRLGLTPGGEPAEQSAFRRLREMVFGRR
jgi:hypothetical protein